MRYMACFDTPQPLIYRLYTALKPTVCILCHITSYTTPSACFNFDQPSSCIAFRYSFEINRVNMRHKTGFDTIQPLIYHLCKVLKPILCILFHITSLYDPLSLFQFRSNFINVLLLDTASKKIVNMRHTTCSETIQPLIYHLCTAVKPILCILCHITSYTTPSASFNFDQTSSTYCL